MRWVPFVYQYSIQILIFAIGIRLALRSGQFRPDEPRGRTYLLMMLATFLVYFLLQGLMQFIIPDATTPLHGAGQ